VAHPALLYPARRAAQAAGRPPGRAAAAAACQPAHPAKVSSRGGIQVARQRIQVGLPHAGQVVTIDLGGTTLRVTGPDGELIATVPRNSTGEISRFKAYGSKHSH